MTRYDPPDYGAHDPTAYDNHGYGTGGVDGSGGHPEPTRTPGWRKPLALAGWGVLIAVLIALIIYGIVLLSRGRPSPASVTTTTTAPASPTTTMTTTTTTSGSPTITSPSPTTTSASPTTTSPSPTTTSASPTTTPANSPRPGIIPRLPSQITLPSIPTVINLPPGL